MKQITVVGLGLIGTSLGLALKQLKNPPRIIGNDIQYDAATRASKLKAVDKVERHLQDAVANSEMVIVATPVGAIPEVLERIAESLQDGCVVTDTGSTKRVIVQRAEEILPDTVAFVGGHPMTGRATGGVDDPDASIFQNAVYCLTPSAATPASAVSTVAAMVQEIGAQPYFTDPVEHDGLVAGVSHLPYLLSVALVRAVAGEPGWREMSALAAGGFETVTRLASYDAGMYADILATNGDNVARHLDRLVAELGGLKARLLGGDREIRRDLEQAQRYRKEWEEQRRRAAARM